MQKDEMQDPILHFADKCRQANLKVTPQRIAIFKQLIKSENHPSADNVFKSIRTELPHISFDTVNRTLQTFSEIGIIDIVESYSGARRFDPNYKNHHHIHCFKCGDIIDFYNDGFDSIEIPESLKKKYNIISKRVVLNVVCSKCRLE
jgi:Fur family transcriptional regulator, peroxide stress response regulator